MISFSRTTEKHTKEYITHLVQSAYYDTEKDIVQLQADPRLYESAENPQLPAAQGDVSPEMAEKLKLLENLGITLDDLEKLFKSR